MQHLLIDTNVYLRMYAFSKDDIEELGKLVELIKVGDIRLHANDQLRDEFVRNREKVLQAELKKAGKLKPAASFPQALRTHPDFLALSEMRGQYEKQLTEILRLVEADARTGQLPADGLIEELFASAEVHPVDTEIVAVARDRFDRGNPPGKDRSYGDAITWETALAKHPHGEALYLITSDRDFESPLRPGHVHQIMEDEWKARVGSDVHVYENLSAFFKDQHPSIKLAADVQIATAIASLANSYNFQATHAAIAELENFPDFNDQQAEALAEAAIDNLQILWILSDSDVSAFYERLLQAHEKSLDPSVVAKLREALDPTDGTTD